MFSSVACLLKRGRLPLLLALLLALGISITSAIASKPPDTASTNPQAVPQPASNSAKVASTNESKPIPGAPHTADAFLFLQPNTTTAGTCPAPSNGGTTQVGCTFVLDLIINTGTSPDDTSAQQGYLTYTYDL